MDELTGYIFIKLRITWLEAPDAPDRRVLGPVSIDGIWFMTDPHPTCHVDHERWVRVGKEMRMASARRAIELLSLLLGVPVI